jgi:hypothetical protein
MDDDHRPRLRCDPLRPDPPVNPLVARYGEKVLALLASLTVCGIAIAVVLVLLHWSLAE